MVPAPPLGVDLNGPRPVPALLLAALLAAAGARADVHVVIVEGLGGEPAYAEAFAGQVDAIASAAASLAAPAAVRVFRGAEASRDALLTHFASLAKEAAAGDRVIVYLVGHGSFDEHEYKFNLGGPDLTGADLAAALGSLPTADQVVVATGSASGALAGILGDPARTLLLATRSGSERHATRFGAYFAAGLGDPGADTDKNGRIDAAEAFDYAARFVADFYEREGRLATEHPLLDGEAAGRIALARLDAPRAPAGDDAELARLRAGRDALEARIEALRGRQAELPPEEYRAALRERMLELARLEDAIERREAQVAPRD